MKALRRLAEIDIITRGVTVKIQQVAVHGNYENNIVECGIKHHKPTNQLNSVKMY
jgi:hypothetical protein